MTKQVLSIEDQMERLESLFYPEAVAYINIRAELLAARGLGEESRARVKLTNTESRINFVLDEWLDFREQLGGIALGMQNERIAA